MKIIGYSVVKMLLLTLAVFINAGAFTYATENVFIIVIDGARYSETFGDSAHRYIPKMWNELRSQGNIYTQCYNDSITYTVPGHSSILTGVWQNLVNDGSTPPYSPTIFEYFRKDKKTAENANYVFLGKQKLQMLAFSSDNEYGPSYGASVKISGNDYEDTATLRAIMEELSTGHPRLAIANLGQTDYIGHSGDYNGYLNTIKGADSIVCALWNFFQNNEFYRNKTTLIVTNDHGRHTDDFCGHGDGCDGCRHIMLMIIGPDIKGNVDTARHLQIDIAPTVGELMDFSTPCCAGNSLVPVRPPMSPFPVFPTDRADNQLLSLPLVWNSVSRAACYCIHLSTSPDFADTVAYDSSLTCSYKIVGPLITSATYYWRVMAKNSAGTSSWSIARSFSTVPELPPQVELKFPEYGDVFSVDNIDLVWHTTLSANGYWLEIATDSSMTANLETDSSIVDKFKSVKNLRNRTTYWWRVKAHYKYGWGPFSVTGKFSISIPNDNSFEKCDFFLYPNTNCGLTINYFLEKTLKVTIRVFDLHGSLLKTFVDSYESQGEHEIAVSRSALPQGCLLMIFKAGETVMTRRYLNHQ